MSLVLCELADASAFGVESLSPFCMKAHLALRAGGLEYERRHGARPDAHKAYNPTGQVPVLLVDGAPVPDSTAILRWVVERAPERLSASAEAWLWEELADTTLSGFLAASRWADDDNWPAVKQAYFGTMPAVLRWFVPDRLRVGVLGGLVARDIWRAGPEACWARFERLLDQLEERAPTGGFWLPEGLSVADVALYAQLRSLRTPLTPRQAGMVEGRRRLSAWLARVEGATVPARAAA